MKSNKIIKNKIIDKHEGEVNPKNIKTNNFIYQEEEECRCHCDEEEEWC